MRRSRHAMRRRNPSMTAAEVEERFNQLLLDPEPGATSVAQDMLEEQGVITLFELSRNRKRHYHSLETWSKREKTGEKTGGIFQLTPGRPPASLDNLQPGYVDVEWSVSKTRAVGGDAEYRGHVEGIYHDLPWGMFAGRLTTFRAMVRETVRQAWQATCAIKERLDIENYQVDALGIDDVRDVAREAVEEDRPRVPPAIILPKEGIVALMNPTPAPALRRLRSQKVVAILERDLVPRITRTLADQEAAAQAFVDFIGQQATERFLILYINARNGVIGFDEYSEGSPIGVGVNPQGILQGALAVNAAGFITAHQHPSGDVTPSADDRRLWERLRDAARLVGLVNLDNFVVTHDGTYYSEEMGATGHVKPQRTTTPKENPHRGYPMAGDVAPPASRLVMNPALTPPTFSSFQGDDASYIITMGEDGDEDVAVIPTTMAEFLDANSEMDPEELDEIRALEPGQRYRGGGGAQPVWTITRVR